MTIWHMLWLSGWAVIVLVWHMIYATQGRVKRQRLIVKPLAPQNTHSGAADDRAWPSTTVIIPARNEADHLRPCLESVLAQDYPPLSVIVVDDRSEDQTAALAESVAGVDARVRVERITQVPPGWMGKSYALWCGSRLAQSDWLLFLDTDCRLQPGAVAAAVTEASRRRVELLTLWPRITTMGFWESMTIPLCGAIVAMWYGLREGVAFANGQFVLIKREAYHRIGGHQAVRDALIEDIPLAQAAKRNGVPSWVGLGRELFSVNMYRGYAATRDGWARIFAGALRSGLKITASIAWLVVGSLLPFLVGATLLALRWRAVGEPTVSPIWWTAAAVLCVWHLVVLFLVSYRFWGLGYCNRVYLLLYPLSVVLVIGVLLRSWWWLIVRRSVVWRNRRYAIDRHGKIRHAVA